MSNKNAEGIPVACDHEWTDDGEFMLVCTKCGTQENHDPKWRDMESAPKDGTLVRLLVSFDEHSTEDADEAPTIGANNFDNDGEDVWRFAGWCWSHDHFTQGVGTPAGWLPMIDTNPGTAELDRVTAERDALQQRLNAADQRIDEQDQEREKLIAYGRSLGLDEASTLCSRMAYDEYYPVGSRFRFFTPKAQEKLGNLLIKAANAITNLPDGPYERFRARLQRKASGSENMIDHEHVVGTTEKVAKPFTEQFIEDHLGKIPQ